MSKKDTTPMPAKAGPPGMNSYFMSYPVFCIGTDGEGLIITGGGGGGRAYGVINYLQAHVAIQNEKNGSVTMETIASMDTGSGAPMALDFSPSQGGVWVSALGSSCLLFKFSDDTLSMEPLYKFRSETNSESHLSNFAKLADVNGQLHVLTGGEDKVLRLWRVDQVSGPGSAIAGVNLVREFPDHQSEIVDADWNSQINPTQFLSCGKDGTVKVWSLTSGGGQPTTTIQPRSNDKKFENQILSIRSAYFVANPTRDIVVLCHHPRGPAFLMLFSQANPTNPISTVFASTTITPSMGINHRGRDKIVVSHAGGEKDVYALPSLRLLHRMNKHSHEMPPGRTLFVNSSLTVSASPDFSLNFYDPRMKRGGFCSKFLLFILLLILALVAVLLLVPESHQVVNEYLPQAVSTILDQVKRQEEL